MVSNFAFTLYLIAGLILSLAIAHLIKSIKERRRSIGSWILLVCLSFSIVLVLILNGRPLPCDFPDLLLAMAQFVLLMFSLALFIPFGSVPALVLGAAYIGAFFVLETVTLSGYDSPHARVELIGEFAESSMTYVVWDTVSDDTNILRLPKGEVTIQMERLSCPLPILMPPGPRYIPRLKIIAEGTEGEMLLGAPSPEWMEAFVRMWTISESVTFTFDSDELALPDVQECVTLEEW